MQSIDKKIVLIIIVFIIAILSIGIYAKVNLETQINMNEQNSFIGTIVQINENSATINVSSEEAIYASGDKISIDLKENIFQKGDKVKVTYNGDIMETYPAQVDMLAMEKIEISKVAKLYTTLIDDIMKQDIGLNSNMKYIAIDINSFVTLLEDTDNGDMNRSYKYPDMSKQDKEDIVNYLYKYHDNIKIASFQELREQGLVNEGENVIPHIDGILIYVTKLEEKNSNNCVVNMTKYRSGLAAIMPEYDAKYENNSWKFEITSMAIS